MSKRNGGLTLLEVLVVVAMIAILAMMLPCATPSRRLEAKKRDCLNNLRQLGVYVAVYVSKYGSDREYPPAPGCGFLDTLRRVPDERTALASAQHGLFVCKVYGSAPGPNTLDYRQPNWSVVQRLDLAKRPIACDRTNNHDVNAEGDMNVLLLDGSVIRAEAGSSEWNEALLYTR